MKIIITLVFIFTHFTNAQITKYNREKLELKENVKYLRETIFEDILEKEDYISATYIDSDKEYIFNKKGDVIERNIYHHKREYPKLTKTNYKYDMQGNLIECTRNSNYNENYNTIDKYAFLYDQNNKLTKEMKYSNRMPNEIKLHFYGSEQKNINHYLKEYEEFKNITFFFYDSKGDNIKKLEYVNQELVSTILYKFEYNNEKNISKKEEIKQLNTDKIKIIYTYDNFGRIVKREKINEEKKQEQSYQYNSLGKEIKSINNYEQFSETVTNYNTKGDIQEKNIYYKNEKKHNYIFKYVYDSHNNWVERRVYTNERLKQIIFRTINYY